MVPSSIAPQKSLKLLSHFLKSAYLEGVISTLFNTFDRFLCNAHRKEFTSADVACLSPVYHGQCCLSVLLQQFLFLFISAQEALSNL